MNVGWSARQPLPQFPQKLTFACSAISDAEGHFQTHTLQHSGIYSITSSAVLSNDAGISIPIALAVLSRFGASGTPQPSAPWRLREISSNRAAKAPAARQTTLTTVTAVRRTSDSTRRA